MGKRPSNFRREEPAGGPGAAVGVELIEVADATFWGLMKIESIALREIHMRLKAPFETSFGIVQNRRILLVETIADGVSGRGKSAKRQATILKQLKPRGTCFPISSLLRHRQKHIGRFRISCSNVAHTQP